MQMSHFGTKENRKNVKTSQDEKGIAEDFLFDSSYQKVSLLRVVQVLFGSLLE